MRAPDLTQKVIGFRQWPYVSRGEETGLKSAGMGDYFWKPGPNLATCLKTKSSRYGQIPTPCLPVANPFCECGFYALHRLEAATHYQGVTGIVLGWGRISVHDSGWRSQWVEILALINTEGGKPDAILRSAAEQYGVPILSKDIAKEYAKEFGDYIPMSLRPSEQTNAQREAHAIAKAEWLAKEATIEKALRTDLTMDPNALAPILNADELMDFNVPEAMAACYDIYVPNPGELHEAINYGVKVEYIATPEPVVPAEIDVQRGFDLSISTNATVLYLPVFTRPS
jgi:hypothetical protein